MAGAAEVRAYFKTAFGFETDEEVESMFDSFLESLGDCVRKLEGLGPEPDFMAVRGVTHAVKGFAVESAMPELADVNLLLNACAKAGDAAAVRAGIRRMRAVFECYRAGRG